MLHVTAVSTTDELEQIRKLNQQNLRQSLSAEEMEKDQEYQKIFHVGCL